LDALSIAIWMKHPKPGLTPSQAIDANDVINGPSLMLRQCGVLREWAMTTELRSNQTEPDERLSSCGKILANQLLVRGIGRENSQDPCADDERDENHQADSEGHIQRVSPDAP
jgi:hypothetical protein